MTFCSSELLQFLLKNGLQHAASITLPQGKQPCYELGASRKKKNTSLFTNFKLYIHINFCCLEGIEIKFELLEEKDVGLLGKCCIRELKPSGEQRTMLRYTRQVPKSAQTLESEHYHTR